MFRKGALPIVVLSAICSTLFYWWIGVFFKEIPVPAIIVFMAYFIPFVMIIGSIYDIIHKVKIKYSKFMLGGGICGVILFTALFNGIACSSVFPVFVFLFALVGLVFFVVIAGKYDKD